MLESWGTDCFDRIKRIAIGLDGCERYSVTAVKEKVIR